jgi:HAE1 family hydrophobic/amphiphilic exporter-1
VYKPGTDTTLAVRASIDEVTTTLAEAIALVILVIFVFLHGFRSVLITALTLPVSLIGTFAFVKLFDFSINTLTLFGLTLATGLVVDDAIVVIENIERLMKQKRLSPIDAARQSMREVSSAVVAISVVLIAVFVPVAFFPGTTGAIYRQFALTIAAAVAHRPGGPERSWSILAAHLAGHRAWRNQALAELATLGTRHRRQLSGRSPCTRIRRR